VPSAAISPPRSLDIAHVVLPSGRRGKDRVIVIRKPDGAVLAVADGAGGSAGGAQAAERALRNVIAFARIATSQAPEHWASLISKADTALSGDGQCALVIAAVVGGRIAGASAGDCGAWLIGDAVSDLTVDQVSKPLVGTGSSCPVAFGAELGSGTLLLASDGLLKYARREGIAALARERDLQAAAHRIADLPRLRSGALPDDLTVILCRASGS
jgi:serine/threonine protein phosphatase PrpC